MIAFAAPALFLCIAIEADVINWRPDYVDAWKESIDTDKPLFSYAGSPDCVHCRKMEKTTFMDNRVINLLNRKFIPVKFPFRSKALPTIYLKTKDKTRKLEGYHDAERLLKELNHEL